ncbi:uncharacterized protein KD926_011310 [Aspergillus affinis]|uniref:uncharacterized protein n=1 Tax=Aspergillus affinis TaxID=1070780 RepID=UPI0022FF2E01|nr:uncharacterized protein KD926_011310 [Aspergillus affinis]KAI9038072.1 hypothetical protein KD926_011310 [Aspergillus affinis]
MADNVGLSDEFGDPLRLQLIQELAQISGLSRVHSATWACLWFADIDSLKHNIEKAKKDNEWINYILLMLAPSSQDTSMMLKAWSVRKKTRKTQITDDSDADDTKASDDSDHDETTPTRKRGFGEPLEVAHIYPYSLGDRTKLGPRIFWSTLKFFWSPAHIAAWEKELLGPKGTEVCPNLMTLVNMAHKLWEHARFALRPLSITEDKKSLKVQFYWLPRLDYSHSRSMTRIPHPFPEDLSSSESKDRTLAKLYHMETDLQVKSKDILTFRTANPITHPLPSFNLLEMQWVLHRVLALSGAADVPYEDLDPDSDMTMWARIYNLEEITVEPSVELAPENERPAISEDEDEAISEASFNFESLVELAPQNEPVVRCEEEAISEASIKQKLEAEMGASEQSETGEKSTTTLTTGSETEQRGRSMTRKSQLFGENRPPWRPSQSPTKQKHKGFYPSTKGSKSPRKERNV